MSSFGLFPNERLWWDLGIGRRWFQEAEMRVWRMGVGSKHPWLLSWLVEWCLQGCSSLILPLPDFEGRAASHSPREVRKWKDLWHALDGGGGSRGGAGDVSAIWVWTWITADVAATKDGPKRCDGGHKKLLPHQASLYRLVAEEARAWRSQDYLLRAARTTQKKRDWAVVGEPTWFSPNLSGW